MPCDREAIGHEDLIWANDFPQCSLACSRHCEGPTLLEETPIHTPRYLSSYIQSAKYLV